MVTVLELAVDTDHLPRYNMRRTASRPPPSARPRVLATPQTESTLVQTTPSSAASLLLEVDAAPIRRYKTRGVTAVTASAAPPSTGGPNTRALTRGRGQGLTDSTHAGAPTLVAQREPRQRLQTGFFTAGAAPSPSTLHAVARRAQAKKQKTEQGTFVQHHPSGPARLSSGVAVHAPTSDAEQPPRAPAPEPFAAIALESTGVAMPALAVLGAGLEVAAAEPLLSVAPAGTGDARLPDAKLGASRTSPSDVISAAAGWSMPLQPQGAYPEVPILVPPPVEEVKNPSEAGGPAPPGSSPPSLPLGARPSTAGESTAPPLRSLPLAFSHLRRPWERTDQQVEQGVAATEWRALAHSQVCTPGPIPNPNSHPHRPPCTAICTLHTPSAPSSTDPYPNSHPHHPPCTRCYRGARGAYSRAPSVHPLHPPYTLCTL